MLMQASRRVGNLVDALGACESLLTTPVPLSYSRHTSRFLTIWCATLPIVLVDQLGYITIPAVAFIGWCLFGIEEIGHLIEQPFRDEQELGTAPALVSSRRFFSYGLPVRRLGRLALGASARHRRHRAAAPQSAGRGGGCHCKFKVLRSTYRSHTQISQRSACGRLRIRG